MFKISGCWNTPNDPGTAQGFRIRKGKTGMVETSWKPQPDMNCPWLGVRNEVDAPGYLILKHRPLGFPKPVAPAVFMSKQNIRSLIGGEGRFSLKKILEAEGCPEAYDWVVEVARRGEVPLVEEKEPHRLAGRMGRFATIGAGEKLLELMVIDEAALANDLTAENFWRCPTLSREAMEARDQDIRRAIAATQEQQAKVRYTKVNNAFPQCKAQQERYMFVANNKPKKKKHKKRRRISVSSDSEEVDNNKEEEALEAVLAVDDAAAAAEQQAAADLEEEEEEEEEAEESEEFDPSVEPPLQPKGPWCAWKQAQLQEGGATWQRAWDQAAAEHIAALTSEHRKRVPAPSASSVAAPAAQLVKLRRKKKKRKVVRREPGMYHIQEILGHRGTRGQDLEYLVWWQGYSQEAATYEPEANFAGYVEEKAYWDSVVDHPPPLQPLQDADGTALEKGV
jgi:hypothetical protein